MAVFGYLVYCLATLWVSVLGLAVFSWPSNNTGEKWFMLVIMGLFWYGAYTWFPFTVSLQ
jgi:hypothetical protein